MTNKHVPLPGDGQIKCQGGRGHWWDPIPTPWGYRPSSWLVVHFRCSDCLTIKRIHVNRRGQVERREYMRDPSWLSYTRDEAPAKDDQRLAYYTSLSEELVATKGPLKKPRRRLSAVS